MLAALANEKVPNAMILQPTVLLANYVLTLAVTYIIFGLSGVERCRIEGTPR